MEFLTNCCTSRIFKHFPVHNHIKEKPIPNSYPQLQGKVEAYNKVVNSEFIALEDIPNIDEGKQRYGMFVKEFSTPICLGRDYLI